MPGHRKYGVQILNFMPRHHLVRKVRLPFSVQLQRPRDTGSKVVPGSALETLRLRELCMAGSIHDGNQHLDFDAANQKGIENPDDLGPKRWTHQRCSSRVSL